ncbi:DinB family protein [Microbulbifer hainanensis]|uniref:DinB family protein n=1 Tax=Microbulbifer hainanensis TaxID=2735675 RepID=UPI00186625CC|nr:DinB family protein [Microbulbifer hainanensis]
MTYTQTLTRYKAWADDLFLSAVSSIPIEELTAPRPIVFGSLIRTLNHCYTMDYVWQCHLLGEPHGMTTRNPEDWPTIEALAASQRNVDQWYVDYANSITEDKLEGTVEFEFIGGGEGCMSRRDILVHVVNHTTYHRGHAADILYSLNVAPPTTDLSVFLRQHSMTAPKGVQ